MRISDSEPSSMSLKLHSHQTPDQPPLIPDPIFIGLVGYDRVKNYPLWLKSVSIPDKPPLYPRCISDAPTLKSRSSRPTPVLPADQSPLCTTNPRPYSWCNHAHYAQYRINPRSNFDSLPQMNNSSKCNAGVQYPKCAHGPYC